MTATKCLGGIGARAHLRRLPGDLRHVAGHRLLAAVRRRAPRLPLIRVAARDHRLHRLNEVSMGSHRVQTPTQMLSWHSFALLAGPYRIWQRRLGHTHSVPPAH